MVVVNMCVGIGVARRRSSSPSVVLEWDVSSCSAKKRVDIVVDIAVVFSSVHFRRANVALPAPPPTVVVGGTHVRPASAVIPPLGWVGSYYSDFAIGIAPMPESVTGSSPPDTVERRPQSLSPSVHAPLPPDNG